MTVDQFKSFMQCIMEMYPGRYENIGELAMEIWYESLQNLEYDIVKGALINHVKTSKYPPTVADIKEYCDRVEQKKEGLTEALRLVYQMIGSYYPAKGNYKKAEDSYWKYINNIAPCERIMYANAVRNTISDYVIRVEQQGLELMNFEDCIEWAFGKDKEK